MGITYKNTSTGAAYTSGTVSSAVGVSVAVGDLIVVGIGSIEIQPTGLTDTAGNTYTLRTMIIGNSAALRTAWCVATVAHASNIFTASFAAGTCSKYVNVQVYSIDIGDTVSLDAAISNFSAWEGSPWVVGTINTTGADAVAIAYFTSGSDMTYTNQEIPSGTAATVLSTASTVATHFYRILTAPATNLNAETDVNTFNAWAGELLVFKSEAAGGRTAMITRAKPLGTVHGMNFGVQY